MVTSCSTCRLGINLRKVGQQFSKLLVPYICNLEYKNCIGQSEQLLQQVVQTSGTIDLNTNFDQQLFFKLSLFRALKELGLETLSKK